MAKKKNKNKAQLKSKRGPQFKYDEAQMENAIRAVTIEQMAKKQQLGCLTFQGQLSKTNWQDELH